ncbi:rhodanese-like domain-containing protein [Shimia abyssi]|uniref:rhodanese-like domain-containing protein n=1 Tax=Shimia abyssi TaxID=1662395 RepID=UPI0013FE35BC|nr:rhodanese-like domain-containing protein [Shimia abyssi]
MLTAKEAAQAIDAGDLILIDIRTPQEWQETGVATGAWPLDMRDQKFGQRLMATLQRNPDKQVAVICRTGRRSAYIVDVLAQNGVRKVYDVSEGMVGGRNGEGWIAAGLPTITAKSAMSNLPSDLRKP